MIADLEILVKLQEVDLEIQSLQEEKNDCPKRLRALEENLASKEAEIEQLNQRVADAEKHKKDVEEELTMESARLSKSQSKLTAIKTNREYQALLKEIDEIKRANKTREEEIISAMEETENLQAEIEAKSKELEQLRKEAEAENKTVKKAEAALEKKIRNLTRQSEKFTKQVRPSLLTRYNFLKEKRNGLALATVSAGICDGCHMNIPPQLYNELLRNDKVHSCPTCQRLIYVPVEKK